MEMQLRFRIWDYIGIQDFADFAGATYNQALRFVQADQRSEYYCYSEAEAEAEVQQMKAEFKSEIDA